MTLEFLGTGTSHGIPVPGCNCSVCRSPDPANHRYRCSALIREKSTSLLIDISPEFRLQAIRSKIERPDAVLVTHSHNDHIGGLDDIRIFTYKQSIPVYTTENCCEEIRQRYSYIFRKTQEGGGKPRIDLNSVRPGESFQAGGIPILPLAIKHGDLEILGFRFGSMAYITDASHLPEKTIQDLDGVKVLCLNALRYRPHSTHFNIEQALAVIKRLRPNRAYLTHFCHDIDHKMLQTELPEGVFAARDGLIIDCETGLPPAGLFV